MQPMLFFPCADVFVSQLPHDKDICRGGEYHRLHVQFRPPDDRPVRPETCRGKKIADIVRRQKRQCIKLEIKNKLHYPEVINQMFKKNSRNIIFMCDDRNLPMFRRNLLFPSAEYESKFLNFCRIKRRHTRYVKELFFFIFC